MNAKMHLHEFGSKIDDQGPMNFAETLLTGRPISQTHAPGQEHGPQLKASVKAHFGCKRAPDTDPVSVKKRGWVVWFGLVVALILGGQVLAVVLGRG